MAKKVLILHGWGGSNSPHWQSWLAAELASDYGKVSFLKFSNFDSPKLDVWRDELKAELDDFRPDIVVCHSLANTLWFHLCTNEIVTEVQKLFLVAPPAIDTEIKELKEFFPVEIPKKLYAKESILVTSTNDPYLPIKEANALQNSLQIPMYVLEDAGHINADSGFGKWDWILQEIQKI